MCVYTNTLKNCLELYKFGVRRLACSSLLKCETFTVMVRSWRDFSGQNPQGNLSQISWTKSCPTLLRSHGLQPTRLLSQWNFPGKNTGMDCHLFLQEIFPTQGSNLCLLDRQVYSLSLHHQESLCLCDQLTIKTPWPRVSNEVSWQTAVCMCCHDSLLVELCSV